MRLKKNFKRLSLFLMSLLCLSYSAMAESVILSAGTSGQIGGEITLIETEAGMFQKGELVFTIASGEAGIYLEDVEVETSGGIKGVKAEIEDGKQGRVTLKINRESKEKGTIKLSQFVITTDRTVPEGSYDLTISGSAIAAGDDKITIKDFIRITTPNTEDCYTGYIDRGISVFTAGKNSYMKNSQEVEMDAAPFIADEGYMMVPIRYVLQAFEINEKDIIYSGDSIMFFTADRSITLTKESSEALVNGSKIALSMPVVIKEGRTYAAVSQIAKLLGVNVEWNGEEKSAVFTG